VYLYLCATETDSLGNHVCPAFQPWAMLGGVIWCLGNATAVTIIKLIGVGLGISIWGSANLLTGWATGKFGLFGLTAESVSQPILNYVGVAIAVSAMLVFLFIQPTLDDGKKGYSKVGDDEIEEGFLSGQETEDDANAESGTGEEASWIDKLSPATKRIYGITLSIIAGVLYGSNFTPPTYIIDHASSFPSAGGVPASSNGIDYVFPHFCGIFLTSTALLLGYSLIMKNKPVLFPRIVLPGFVSGLIWSVAQISWFVANSKLGLVLAFPIIAVGPGLVSALWGVYLGEIRGTKNLLLLGGAFSLVATSSICIAFSH
jgi:Transmembrane family, TMEM144 of transporters